MGIVTLNIVSPTTGTKDVLEYVQIKSLQVEHYINNRPVLRCRLRIRDGDTYRPKVRDEIIFEDDNGPPGVPNIVRLFGGIIFSIKETDVVDYKHCDLDLDCTGYEVFADTTLINGIVAAGTTKSILEAIVTNVGHDITVDDSMLPGPDLPAQGFPWLTCREAMDQLATVSQMNWKFDHYKEVKMTSAGGAPGATFDLTENDGSIVSLTHTKSLANYVNEVWVLFGEPGQREKTDTWEANGTDEIFVLDHPPVGIPPYVKEATGVAAGTHPVALAGSGGDFRWYYNPGLHQFELADDEDPPEDGVVISATFTAQYPGAVYARHGEWTTLGPSSIVVEYQDIEEYHKAQLVANGELERRSGVVRRLTATTYKPGLEPGMSVNVIASKRGPNANFLIERVSIAHETRRHDGSHLFRYEIEALEGNQYQSNWVEYFRGLQGKRASGSGGGVVSGGGGVGTVSSVTYAFWGGSRQFGQLLNGWANVIDYMPIKITAPPSGGPTVTVRVMQRQSGGIQVRTRIVNVGTGLTKIEGAAYSDPGWDEELLTFSPDPGTYDYALQVFGSSTSAQVFAIGMTL